MGEVSGKVWQPHASANDELGHEEELPPAEPWFDTPEGFRLICASGFQFPFTLGGVLETGLSGKARKKAAQAHDSSWQNTAEFLTVTAALAILAEMGVFSATIRLIMDSKSALKWAKCGQSRSQYARWPLMTFTAVTMEAGLFIGETAFVRSEDNQSCDALSRAEDPEAELTAQGIDRCLWRFPSDELWALLDPTRPWPEEDEEWRTQWTIRRSRFAHT